MSKVRSARGRIVDFNLLAMKERIKSKTVPINVEERERYIHEKNKIHRKRPSLKRPQGEVPSEKQQKEAINQQDVPKQTRKTKVKRRPTNGDNGKD